MNKFKTITLILIGIVFLSACSLVVNSTVNDSKITQKEPLKLQKQLKNGEGCDLKEGCDCQQKGEGECLKEKPCDCQKKKVILDTPEPNNDIVKSTSYQNYSSSKLAEYKGNRPVALFFYASWCPGCRKLDKEINENLNDLEGATILKINYDAESSLKKEYQIRTQHTVVFLDANGEVVDTKVGSNVDPILDFFNN